MAPRTELKQFAVFDIDGTIFRSSLVRVLCYALADRGVFPRSVYEEIEPSYVAWANRYGSYEVFITKVIETFEKHLAGKEIQEVEKVARLVLDRYKERTYRYTRGLIESLRPHHRLIAISFSPREVVETYNRMHLHFDHTFYTAHAVKDGRYTGAPIVRRAREKAALLRDLVENEELSFKNSYGVGDTESDIELLELVEHPIAFNPNLSLYTHARDRGWKIVVERKDVIYEL